MMPTVELTAPTFTRLQAHAVPLVDTIETVINRLLDDYERKAGVPVLGESDDTAPPVQAFNPDLPPSLTHTKLLAVELDGKPLPPGEMNWNGLLNATIRRAKEAAQSSAQLKQLITANFVEGKQIKDGYRFLSDIGLSVQGQDANGAWKASRHVCQQLKLPLKVTFIWRDKEDAAFPGKTGQFSL